MTGTQSEKMKHHKNMIEIKRLNRKFAYDPKSVYHSMKGNTIEVKDMPTKDDIQAFWKSIWNVKIDYNTNAPWINELKSNYCANVSQKDYEINLETLSQALSKIQNNKTPGRDMIIGFWYKKLQFHRPYMVSLFQKILSGEYDFPAEIVLAKTVLIPKNENTKIAKNYRPIACLNLMYKLYTSCLNLFIQDHCESNEIVTDEQAGGKKCVWGCAEQLLINIAVLKEVKKQRRNLITVWLDYAKAFDSVSHSWLFTALRLAKVPENIVVSIEKMSKLWATIVTLKGANQTIKTDIVTYLKGIFQGDSLSVILFVLGVNPLSFMIKRLRGYAAGKDRNTKITHNFFVDDLKLYNSTTNGIKKQLDLVTRFSQDIGMNHGQGKCAHLVIEKGQIKHNGQDLEMNGVKIQQVDEGECYKYLGQDENISYVGTVNKERVCKE